MRIVRQFYNGMVSDATAAILNSFTPSREILIACAEEFELTQFALVLAMPDAENSFQTEK